MYHNFKLTRIFFDRKIYFNTVYPGGQYPSLFHLSSISYKSFTLNHNWITAGYSDCTTLWSPRQNWTFCARKPSVTARVCCEDCNTDLCLICPQSHWRLTERVNWEKNWVQEEKKSNSEVLRSCVYAVCLHVSDLYCNFWTRQGQIGV